MTFGTTPKGTDNIPIACVYVPGVGFVALQGSTLTNTDASSNQSAPANFNVAQIGAVAAQMATADAVTPGNVLEIVPAFFNDQGGVDRQRGNEDALTALTSAAITANGNSNDFTNYNHRGVKVYVKTGTFGASESTMLVTIQGKDQATGTYYTILQSAAAGLSASSFIVLSIYPGLVASTGLIANDVLPRTWRISWSATNWGTGGSTLGITYGLNV